MILFIDTSTSDLFISLVKNNKTVKYKLIKNLVKKADNLPIIYHEVVGDLTSKITSIFITIGPGSFVGSRVGLVFARTLCQFTNTQLYTTTSLQLISNLENKDVYIDARSKKSYHAHLENGKIIGDINLVPFQNTTKFDYSKLIKSPNLFFHIYKKEKNILEVEPIYIKSPQIGGK